MKNITSSSNWQVLLLGGASGVGKNQCKLPPGSTFWNRFEVDDFQVVLEKLTTPEQMPLLHFCIPIATSIMLDGGSPLATLSEYALKYLALPWKLLSLNHLESNTPVRLEGDFRV